MLENQRFKSAMALANYRIGIGERHNHITDQATGEICEKLGQALSHTVPFGFNSSFSLNVGSDNPLDTPLDVPFVAISNGDNTSAKVYMLVEVCDIEMTDESLRLK